RFYDTRGRIIKIVYPDAQAVSYLWDDANCLREAGLEGGKKIAFGYNEMGQLSAISYPGGSLFSYSYDGKGRLSRCLFPNQTFTVFSYDNQSRLVEVSNGDLSICYQWLDFETPSR